jgi:arylsulfatase A
MIRCASVTLAVLAVYSTVATSSAAADGADRPNIIFIMADDLGWKELGCYGQQKIRTPHIDQLALQGMRFMDYYSGAPVCAPSRCVLMTGKHMGHAQVKGNFEVEAQDRVNFRGQWPLAKDTTTVASVLKSAGYVTGAFGKWGLGGVGSTGDPLKQGFDRFFGYNCQRHAHNLFPRYLVDNDQRQELSGNDRGLTGEEYAPQLIADQLLKFIRSNQDRPFFVYYPTIIPHLALQVPDEELQQYEGQWDETPYTGGQSYLPHPKPRAAYASMITFLDKQVGRITALLKELDLADNTIVFFTSDNGTTYLDRQVDFRFFDSVGPLKGLKGSVYEGGIRVPMIVTWPGHVQPQTSTRLVCGHVDAIATIADVVGVDLPDDVDRISYLPTLLGRDTDQAQHSFMFWDYPEYGGQIAVRWGKWKGVKQDLRKTSDSPLELYDLDADIGEQQNVVADHADVAERIESIMLEQRELPLTDRWRFGKYKGQ